MKRQLKLLVSGILVWAAALSLSETALTESTKPVTNSDVVQMVKAHLKDSVIMKAIEANGAELDISPPALMELRKARVSQGLIEAMIDYSQRKNSSVAPLVAPFICGPASGNPGEGFTAAQVLFKVDPEYSEKARKAKFQGTVVLNICVQKNGSVGDARVVQPLGLGLDEKAVEAVKQWRFRPGMKNGSPVDVKATVEVTFRL